MAGSISVSLRSDPAPFEAGVQEARAALDGFVDAIESGADDAAAKLEELIRQIVTLGRQAGKSGEEIAEDLEKIGLSAEDAQDAVKAVERETSKLGDSARDVDRAADAVEGLGDAAQGAGDDVAQVGDKAEGVGEGLRSLGDIAKSVLEGDFAGAAQGAVDGLLTLAGAAGLGGAAGSAIAGAVGTVIDHIVGLWQTWHDALQSAREDAHSFAVELGTGMDWESYAQGVKSWTDNTEQWAKANDIAKVAGWEVKDAIDALVQGGPGLASLMADFDKGINDGAGGLEITGQRLLDLDGTLRGTAEGFASAGDAASASAGLMYDYAVAAGEATGKVDAFGNAIVRMPDGKEVVINAATQQAHADVDHFVKQPWGTTVAVSADISAAQAELDRWSPTKTVYFTTSVGLARETRFKSLL